MTTTTIIATIALSSISLAWAQSTPIQPWSGYKVHDNTRPTPEKALNAKALNTTPPDDAIIIFNGTSTAALIKKWPIKDGVLIASKLGDNRTVESFGDCQVHLEWRIPAGRKVKGQSGGNSGIFLMDKYEVQIQESHSNVTYADGQAGALYGQFPPLKNASTPQGEWQSYDILFKAPRYNEKGMTSPAVISVIHNGVAIHNAQPLIGPTVFRRLAEYPQSHPQKAPIRLQWHRDPIEFRNFWVRPLAQQTQKPEKP